MLTVTVCSLFSLGVIEDAPEPMQAVPIIYDTDMGNDVDDGYALGVLHALQSRGECDLLAVTVTKDHELAGPFVDVRIRSTDEATYLWEWCATGPSPSRASFWGSRLSGYFSLSERGRVSYDDRGYTGWTEDPSGRHQYLIVDETQIVRVKEVLATLASEPPHR